MAQDLPGRGHNAQDGQDWAAEEKKAEGEEEEEAATEHRCTSAPDSQPAGDDRHPLAISSDAWRACHTAEAVFWPQRGLSATRHAQIQALPGQQTAPDRGQAEEIAFSDASSQASDVANALAHEFDAIGTFAAEHLLPVSQEDGEWELLLRNNRTGECFPVASAEYFAWRQYRDRGDRRYWYSAQGQMARWFYHPE